MIQPPDGALDADFPIFKTLVPFNTVMVTAESLALDPSASPADLRREWTYLLSLHGD